MTTRITADKVIRAFGGVGLGPIRFVSPIHRNGPAWAFIVDLPSRLNLAAATAKTRALARNLGVSASQLTIGRVRGGPDRRIDVRINDRRSDDQG